MDFAPPRTQPVALPPERESVWRRAAVSGVPAVACMAAVCLLSETRLSFSMLPCSGVTRHVLAFGAVATLLWRAFQAAGGRLQRWSYGLALAATSLFGALDEYHHLFVRGRDADVTDWLVDTLAALGVLAAIRLARAVHARRRSAPVDTMAPASDPAPTVVVCEFTSVRSPLARVAPVPSPGLAVRWASEIDAAEVRVPIGSEGR